jgi:Peptidase M50B-like
MAVANIDLNPSESQIQTVYWILGYIVFISIVWHVPYLEKILWPFKILTVALHEFGHASAGILTGAKILSITLDPNEGGLTKMRGGNPYISLPAGYIGSLFWGSAMVFAGFNTTGAKVVSVLVGLAMLMTLVFARNWLAVVITILAIGVFGLLWWLEDSIYLRYYVLFLGVMSSLYSLWDIVDDLIARKVNESDASQYSRLCCKGAFSPKFWVRMPQLIYRVLYGFLSQSLSWLLLLQGLWLYLRLQVNRI